MLHSKKTMLFLFIAIFIAFLLFVCYMLVFQPIIAWCFFSPEIHEGVDLYLCEKYLEFEEGKSYKYALSTLPFLYEEKIIGFKYHDNKKSDNLFYGKMCDAYILELDLDEYYDAAIKYILSVGKECYPIAEYNVYWFEDSVISNNNSFYVSFCEKTNVIRIIFVTEYENDDYNAWCVGELIEKRFNFDWTMK